MSKLIVIQDIATPHNNLLLHAVRKHKPKLDLELWYCQTNPRQYNWQKDLLNEVVPANLYDPAKIDWAMIRRVLFACKAKILLIGWQNPTTRALFILLCLLRKRFAMWFDYPLPDARLPIHKRWLRAAHYRLLGASPATVFYVEDRAKAFLLANGVKEHSLVRMPFAVDISISAQTYAAKRKDIRAKYGVGERDFLISCGSRLVYDKGLDIVIAGLASVPAAQRKAMKVVLVGRGEQSDAIKAMVAKHKLGGHVTMVDWMELEDFQALIGVSNVFIHPARFDPYGNAMYALPMGIPVIGSKGAGASLDAVRHGVNGLMFTPDKPEELGEHLVRLEQDPALHSKMAKAARAGRNRWAPEMLAEILLNGVKA